MKTFAVVLTGMLALAAPAMADSEASYKVTFRGTWAASTHPLEYPSGAHFSGLIGATHDGRYVLFRAGATATPGLERLAEAGAHSPLDGEIRAVIAEGKAGSLIENGPIFNPPGSSTATFKVTEKHPMVSLVAMIAPSPDWFTGVADLKLMEKNAWVERHEVTAYAWDAGTDSGTTYVANDIDTNPRNPIAENGSPHFMANGGKVPVGVFVFERISPSPQMSGR